MKKDTHYAATADGCPKQKKLYISITLNGASVKFKMSFIMYNEEIEDLAYDYFTDVEYFDEYYEDFVRTFNPSPTMIWAIQKMLELNEKSIKTRGRIMKSKFSFCDVLNAAIELKKESRTA